MRQREEIAKIVIALAEYYDKKLSPSQIAMYVEELCDLTAHDLARAVKLYRRDPKNVFFPLPAKLEAMVKTAWSAEEESREAAGRIVTAISRIGPYDPKRARDHVGELAWQIVIRQGGWASICESVTFANLATLQAQWRELGISIYHRSERGSLDTAPALPTSSALLGGRLERISFSIPVPQANDTDEPQAANENSEET